MKAERALYWEYARLAWPVVMGLSIAGCALAGLYRAALEPLGERRDTLAFVAVLSTLALVSVLAMLNVRAEGLALGFERRLYRLPLPSWRLALARQISGLIATSAILLVVTLCSRLLYGVDWPIVGPVLLTAVILAWAQAISWSYADVPFLIAPACAPVAVSLFWLTRPHLRAANPYESFALTDALALGGFLGLGTVAGVLAVGLDRAGKRLIPGAFLSRRRQPGPSRRQQPLVTPRAAVLWREWMEKGRLLTAWTALAILLNLAMSGAGSPSFSADRLLSGLISWSGFMLLAGPAIAGFLHARFDLETRDPGIDRLRATLPLTNQRLAWDLLIAIQRTLGASWVVLVLSTGGALLLVGSGSRAPWMPILEAATSRPAAAGLAAVLALLWFWVIGGLVAALVLTGRTWVVGVGVFLPYGLLGLAFVTQRITGRDLLQDVAVPAAISIAPTLLGATLVGCFVAIRRQLLRPAPTVLSLLGLAMLGGLAAWQNPWIARLATTQSTDALELSVLLLLPAFACSALLPVALAPMALAWNRHR